MIKKLMYEVYESSKIGFATMGVMWTLVEMGEVYFSHLPILIENKDNIKILLVPAIIVVFCRLLTLKILKFRIKYEVDDITIIVQPGNILKKKDGVNVVGVNNQLYTHKDKIEKNSIHSKMIDEYGGERMLVTFRNGKKKIDDGNKYFQDNISDIKYLFLPMSNVDDGAASTSISIIKDALKDLFYNQEYLTFANKKMNIPVIGTGAAGVNLDKQGVIKLIVNTFLNFQKESNEKSSSKIKILNIIVYYKDIGDLDWIKLDQWMNNRINYCQDCSVTESVEKI